MPFDRVKMKRLREKLGLTQQQAAEKAGMKIRQAWHLYESGRKMPSLPTLEKIAKALGVATKDLLK